MSEFKKPMLCNTTLRDELDNDRQWAGYVAEPKYDGMRCVAVVGEDVQLYGRSGINYTACVPHLAKQLEYLLPAGSIIDGELAIVAGTVNVGGAEVPVTDFNKTMRIMGSAAKKAVARQTTGNIISYLVYDVLELGNDSALTLPWETRRRLLESLRLDRGEDIIVSPVFENPAAFGTIFDTLTENGVEGLVVKNASSTYRPGDRSWCKVKTATTIDMVVSGFTPGKGRFAEQGQIGAIEFSRWTPAGLVYVARCSGMTDAMRREISANTSQYLGKVVEVKSNDLVGSKEYRTPRHPQFVCFRNDKTAQDCVGEELKA